LIQNTVSEPSVNGIKWYVSDLRVTIHQLFLVWVTTCVAGHSGNWNHNVSFLFSYNLSEKFIHHSSILLPEISPFAITVLSGTTSFLCAQILTWRGLSNSSTPATSVSLGQPHLPPLALAAGDRGLGCSAGYGPPFIQPQVSALPLAQSSGEHILTNVLQIPFKTNNLQWLWGHLILCDHDYRLPDLNLLVQQQL